MKQIWPGVWAVEDDEELKYREALAESVKKFGKNLNRKDARYCLTIKRGDFWLKKACQEQVESCIIG